MEAMQSYVAVSYCKIGHIEPKTLILWGLMTTIQVVSVALPQFNPPIQPNSAFRIQPP
jgi:hypothetical protein